MIKKEWLFLAPGFKASVRNCSFGTEQSQALPPSCPPRRVVPGEDPASPLPCSRVTLLILGIPAHLLFTSLRWEDSENTNWFLMAFDRNSFHCMWTPAFLISICTWLQIDSWPPELRKHFGPACSGTCMGPACWSCWSDRVPVVGGWGLGGQRMFSNIQMPLRTPGMLLEAGEPVSFSTAWCCMCLRGSAWLPIPFQPTDSKGPSLLLT